MMRNWLLPEHIEDILPSEARRFEQLRRAVRSEERRVGKECRL